MIDRAQATTLVERHLAKIAPSVGVELVVDYDEILEGENGWMFFWTSRAFLESGAISDALAGNGPLFVHRETAVLEQLRTDLPVESLVAELLPDVASVYDSGSDPR